MKFICLILLSLISVNTFAQHFKYECTSVVRLGSETEPVIVSERTIVLSSADGLIKIDHLMANGEYLTVGLDLAVVGNDSETKILNEQATYYLFKNSEESKRSSRFESVNGKLPDHFALSIIPANPYLYLRAICKRR